MSAYVYRDWALQEEKFALIRNNVTSLIEAVLQNIQSKDRGVQDQLCREMCELESYIEGIYRKFPVNPINDNISELDSEVKWVDAKVAHILKILESDKIVV